MSEATNEGASLHDILVSKLESGTAEEAVSDDNVAVEETVVEETEVTDDVDTGDEVSEESTETQEDETTQDANTLELPDLANYLGYDAEKLDVNDSGELVFKTKIDGKDGQATLNELVKNHQLDGHLTNKNMEVAELKKQLNTQIESSQAEKTRLGERLQQAEDLTTVVYQSLLSEYETVDWNELRQDDPGEYSARQTDFQARKNQIAEQYQNIQTQKEETQTASLKVSDERLLSERAKLVTAMGWTDTDKSKKEIVDLSAYATSQGGFSQAEFNSIPDHRYIVALSKAAKYDSLQKENPRITNKVKKAPKLVKPGTPRSKASDKDKVTQLRANIKKKDGKHGSIAQYLLQTGKV